MRLTPVAVSIFPRLVSKGGVTVLGRFIPEGTEVTCQSHVCGRNKQLYGKDATEYRPERWLEADENTLADWDRFDFNWAYGSRACIGKNIALMQLHKILVQFFRMFETVVQNYGVYHNGGTVNFVDIMVKLKLRV